MMHAKNQNSDDASASHFPIPAQRMPDDVGMSDKNKLEHRTSNTAILNFLSLKVVRERSPLRAPRVPLKKSAKF